MEGDVEPRQVQKGPDPERKRIEAVRTAIEVAQRDLSLLQQEERKKFAEAAAPQQSPQLHSGGSY